MLIVLWHDFFVSVTLQEDFRAKVLKLSMWSSSVPSRRKTVRKYARPAKNLDVIVSISKKSNSNQSQHRPIFESNIILKIWPVALLRSTKRLFKRLLRKEYSKSERVKRKFLTSCTLELTVISIFSSMFLSISLPFYLLVAIATTRYCSGI